MCVRASHSLVPVNNFNGILFLFSLFFSSSHRAPYYIFSLGKDVLRSAYCCCEVAAAFL
jgi:hypothetical protein